MVVCSKQGYISRFSPVGVISLTVVPAGAMHPAVEPVPATPDPVIFSEAKTPAASSAAEGSARTARATLAASAPHATVREPRITRELTADPPTQQAVSLKRQCPIDSARLTMRGVMKMTSSLSVSFA